MAKVEIFTTPNCPYCRMAKEFFKQNHIEYIEYDVTTDEAKAKEMILKSGQRGVPVSIVDGKLVVGFNKMRLSELVGIKK